MNLLAISHAWSSVDRWLLGEGTQSFAAADGNVAPAIFLAKMLREWSGWLIIEVVCEMLLNFGGFLQSG